MTMVVMGATLCELRHNFSFNREMNTWQGFKLIEGLGKGETIGIGKFPFQFRHFKKETSYLDDNTVAAVENATFHNFILLNSSTIFSTKTVTYFDHFFTTIFLLL